MNSFGPYLGWEIDLDSLDHFLAFMDLTSYNRDNPTFLPLLQPYQLDALGGEE